MPKAAMAELAGVLAPPKFDSYVSVAGRQKFLRLLGFVGASVPILYWVRA